MNAYDVAVVGAGPAGSTAARFAALGGARTLLVERRREVGRPVQCGEFLPTTAVLRSMFPRARNIEGLFEGARPFVRTRTRVLRVFSPAGRSYDVPFGGLVLDRDRFDRSLAEAAVSAGAELWKETRVFALRGNVLETERGEVRARVVVGADGPRSVVARDAGFAPLSHMAFGVQYPVRGLGLDPHVVEMYFGPVAPGGYAWVIPKGGDLANVGVGMRPVFSAITTDRAATKGVLDGFIRMLESRGRRRAGRLRFTAGFIPVSGPRRRAVLGNVLLAGDAAGHLMPSNGGGIPTAMIAGSIAGTVAAQHVRDGLALSAYEKRCREAVGRELASATTTRRIFDAVSRFPAAMEFAMMIAGPRGMFDLFSCRPWYKAGIHA